MPQSYNVNLTRQCDDASHFTVLFTTGGAMSPDTRQCPLKNGELEWIQTWDPSAYQLSQLVLYWAPNLFTQGDKLYSL